MIEESGSEMLGRRNVHFELADQLQARHTALVLVDVQNDFVHPEGWVARQQMPGYLDSTAVARSGSLRSQSCSPLPVRPTCCGSSSACSETCDTYPRRCSPSTGVCRGRVGPARRSKGHGARTSTRRVMPDGSDREISVDKYRYSAFAGTRLDLILRSHRIETLVLCGVATSGCVESTTRDGLFHDYYVVTAADCCADVRRETPRIFTPEDGPLLRVRGTPGRDRAMLEGRDDDWPRGLSGGVGAQSVRLEALPVPG